MEAIVGLIGNLATIILCLFKDITEEEIDKNIKYLKQEKWFQAYLLNEKHTELISYNTKARNVIGSMNIKKMSKSTYSRRQQKRIERVINKQS
ncbi:hypothetical protein [Psychrobacillus sp. NPDC096389]|uniref:hypothetical protein n=1 Tax=Psychrobacillus sp. NPDC096389 TaxID=3364490 RepID=UPI0037FB70E4